MRAAKQSLFSSTPSMENMITKTESPVGIDKHWQKHWFKNLRPWKPGQSGNLKGRPKGKSLKEYTREYLANMTDEQRAEFLDGIPKMFIWRMAEGNPSNAVDINTQGQSVIVTPEARKRANEALMNFLNTDE